MAKILAATVVGLGGLDKLFDRELNPQLSVFFGKNGGGKTTLLRTLHSAVRDDATILAESPVTAAEVLIDSGRIDGPILRTLSIQESPRRKQLALSLLASPPSPQAEVTYSWITDHESIFGPSQFSSTYLAVSRLYREALKSNNTRLFGTPSWARADMEDPAASEPSLEATFVGQFLRRWQTYSNRILAEIQHIHQEGIASILQALLLTSTDQAAPLPVDRERAYQIAKSFFDRQPELSRLTEDRGAFVRNYDRNSSLQAVMQKIETVESRIASAQAERMALENFLNRLFAGKVVQITDTSIDFKMLDGRPLELSQLSTGEKQLLNLCVETLIAEPHTTVFIDEPELSLHVDWQRILLPTLRALSPDVQIIVATHSPEITADVDDKHIFRV